MLHTLFILNVHAANHVTDYLTAECMNERWNPWLHCQVYNWSRRKSMSKKIIHTLSWGRYLRNMHASLVLLTLYSPHRIKPTGYRSSTMSYTRHTDQMIVPFLHRFCPCFQLNVGAAVSGIPFSPMDHAATCQGCHSPVLQCLPLLADSNVLTSSGL